MQGQESMYQSGESDQLWTDAETLYESLDFSDGKHIFIASLLALGLKLGHYNFLLIVKLNYRTIFSWKVLNINWLCFPSYVYFFENDVF